MGRGRPGGNPDFGKKYKFDYGNEEKRSVPLTIRITESMFSNLKELAGNEFRNYCLQAIAEKIEHDSKQQKESSD